jgi:hypothetical protein
MAVLEQIKDSLLNEETHTVGLAGKTLTPIGIGKPLSIEILSFYTGKFEKKLIGNKEERQLLIVSSIKNIEDVKKPAKAINQLINGAVSHKLRKPTVDSEGSPLLFYTRALDQFNLKINIKIGANRINNRLLNHVGNLIEESGSLPTFLGASPYLASANKAIKLGSKLIEFFHESNALFDEDIDLSINSDFMKDARSGVEVQIPRDKESEFEKYETKYVDPEFGSPYYELRHKEDGTPYRGDTPYVVIGITGKERPNLENFMPLIASQKLLNDFYGEKGELTPSVIGEFNEAMSLLNDMKYLKKAREQSKKLAQMNPGSEDFEKGQNLLEAYIGNITEEVIRSGFKNSLEAVE